MAVASERTAVVFPGQGTQRPGMGLAWRGHPAWQVVEEAEALVGEPLGRLLTDADEATLRRTREAQLAILLTSLVAWRAVRDHLDLDRPVAFAGHSLGQVTALIAAGVLDLRTGIEFAARRATATQSAADAHPGRMAALLGADLEQAEAACSAVEGCWIANDNAPGQVVIAGTPHGVEAGSEAAREAGVRRISTLNVGGAFHTPLMEEAVAELEHHLTGVAMADAVTPIIANDDAAPATAADLWRHRSAAHVARRVRWRETQVVLADLGAERFVEVGAGSMLAALAKRTVPGVTIINVAEPADLATAES
jgi:[acyl-carrier-protein] S-malonyltransferase